MCNTPKYAKLEERTGIPLNTFFFILWFSEELLLMVLLLIFLSGYGGGFNERENVEYIEREESDGEYDEVSVFSSVIFDVFKIIDCFQALCPNTTRAVFTDEKHVLFFFFFNFEVW